MQSGWLTVSRKEKAARFFEDAIFVALVLIAASSAISTKGAAGVFRLAVLAWALGLLSQSLRAKPQPLTAALLAFLLLTAISTIFSQEPLLSWDRMKTVTLLGLAVLIGQNLSSLRRVRILLIVLLAFSLVTVFYTATQYAVGVGVEVVELPQNSPGSRAGLLPHDIVQKVNGASVHSPSDWLEAINAQPGGSGLRLTVLRGSQVTGSPSVRVELRITKEELAESGLAAKDAPLRQSRPIRVEGFFRHYFPYAEFLASSAVLFFALSFARQSKVSRILVLLGFVALSATMVLTLTRIVVLSFVIACVAVTIEVSSKRKWWIIAFVVLAFGLSGAWIASRRNVALFSSSDPGTQYRLLMWRDSIQMIRNHPWVGVGLDSVAGHWQRWDLEAYKRFPLKSHFHSTLIQFAVECGIFTALAWLFLLGNYFVFLRGLLKRLRHDTSWRRGLALGVYGAFLSSVLISMVQYNWGDAEVMMVFWFQMGLAIALHRLTATDLVQEPERIADPLQQSATGRKAVLG
jgi:O-antigen ligase